MISDTNNIRHSCRVLVSVIGKDNHAARIRVSKRAMVIFNQSTFGESELEQQPTQSLVCHSCSHG